MLDRGGLVSGSGHGSDGGGFVRDVARGNDGYATLTTTAVPYHERGDYEYG